MEHELGGMVIWLPFALLVNQIPLQRLSVVFILHLVFLYFMGNRREDMALNILLKLIDVTCFRLEFLIWRPRFEHSPRLLSERDGGLLHLP